MKQTPPPLTNHTDDGKDDHCSKHWREEVGQRHEDGVSVAVVAHGVVRREGDESSEGQPEREEDLRAGLEPHNWIGQLLPL